MRVRSKTHWTGESTAAANGRSDDRPVVDHVHVDDGRGAQAPQPATVAARQRAGGIRRRGLLVRHGQRPPRPRPGRRPPGPAGRKRELARPRWPPGGPPGRRLEARVEASLDSGDLGAQGDPGAQLGQQGRARVAVQFAQREGGDADVGRVVLAEQAGLDHGGGQRQRGVVAGDVQGGDGEQVPQGAAGPVALPGAASQSPKRCLSAAGSAGSTQRIARAGRETTARSAKERNGYLARAGSICRGPGSAVRRSLARRGRCRPGARTVTSKRSCSGAWAVMPSWPSRPR